MPPSVASTVLNLYSMVGIHGTLWYVCGFAYPFYLVHKETEKM